MMAAPARELHDYVAALSESADVRAGSPLPLGTQETAGGVNFALFSRHASRVQLELFAHPEDAVPARVIELDAARHRTGDVWHVWVKGIGTGQGSSRAIVSVLLRFRKETLVSHKYAPFYFSVALSTRNTPRRTS
jgi:hypothetical protein